MTAVNLNTVEVLYLSGTNNEGVANASLGSASLVAGDFNNEFAITSSNGQDALLVINDTDGKALPFGSISKAPEAPRLRLPSFR